MTDKTSEKEDSALSVTIRRKIGSDFAFAVQGVWREKKDDILNVLAVDYPDKFAALVEKMTPKEFVATGRSVTEMSDAEIIARLAELDANRNPFDPNELCSECKAKHFAHSNAGIAFVDSKRIRSNGPPKQSGGAGTPETEITPEMNRSCGEPRTLLIKITA